MGSLCSKSGAHSLSSGHTVLASPSSSTNPGAPSRGDPRAAAAEAAERRLKAVSLDFTVYRFAKYIVYVGASKGYIRL